MQLVKPTGRPRLHVRFVSPGQSSVWEAGVEAIIIDGLAIWPEHPGLSGPLTLYTTPLHAVTVLPGRTSLFLYVTTRNLHALQISRAA